VFLVLWTPLVWLGRRHKEPPFRWWRPVQQLNNGGSMEAHTGMAGTTDIWPWHCLAQALFGLVFRL